MFGQKDKRERTIIEIIKIGKNIKCIYDNMNLQNRESLEKELKVEITKENYLLDSLNIKEGNSNEIYHDFVNVLNESLLDDFKVELKDPSLQKMLKEYIKISNTERLYTNDLILKRFESYLLKRFRSTPKKSKEIKDNSKRRKEDRATITHAAIIDYQLSTVRFLKDLVETTDSLSIANRAIMEINKNLLTDKLIEEKYFNNDFALTKKDECIKAGLKEDYVEDVYFDFAKEAIDEQSRHCYLMNNATINDKKNSARVAVEFQKLKASLYLIDRDIIIDSMQSYQPLIVSTGKKSVQLMVDSMQDVITIKDAEKLFVRQKKVIV